MISNGVKFWIYLFALIQAILCTIFVLYHILRDRILRRAIHNHIIIILLCLGFCCQLTNYPWMLYFYRVDGDWDRSDSFCSICAFFDWGLYATQTILFAWATIERHILIFHDRLVATKCARFLFHYLPIALLLLYCAIYYIIYVFFPPCEQVFDKSVFQCNLFCALEVYSFLLYEMVTHQVLPVFIIVVSSLLLLLRVVWQKHRMHRPMNWRKHRKMIIQILSISILYLVFVLPLALMWIIPFANQTTDDISAAFDVISFMSYFPTLLLPAVCVLSVSEIRFKITKMVRFRKLAFTVVTIHPSTF